MNVATETKQAPFKIGDPVYVLEHGMLWLSTVTELSGPDHVFLRNGIYRGEKCKCAGRVIRTVEEAESTMKRMIETLERELEKLESGHYEHLS